MTHIITKKTTKKDISKLTKGATNKATKGVDLEEFCGILQLKEDPLKIQKKLRNEWK